MFSTTTTTYLGFSRRADESARRGSFLGMNHLQLTDRGSIQLVDGVERFHTGPSETFVSGRRVKIVIRGEVFETFEETLMRFPDTLLGSRRTRRKHYVAAKDALVFAKRDKFAFNAILFFYQSGGILSRPSDVPFNIFAQELEFFQLTEYFPDSWIMKTIAVDVPETLPWHQTLWLLFEDPKSSIAAMIISWISLAFIVLTTGLFCFETTEMGYLYLCEKRNGTVPFDRAAYCDQKDAWFILDSIITAWFLLEYVVRLIAAARKRLKFLFSFLGMIDFLALVPYFGIMLLERSGKGWTRDYHEVATLLRILRLVRVIRVLKLAHHIEALRLLGYTISQCMYLLIGLMLLVSILTISLSSSIYLAERSSPTSDIKGTPDAAWFVVITLTNVGYGDVVPNTFFGKLLGGIAAVLGILVVFILPAPVLLNHFEDIYKLRKERKKRKKNGMMFSSFSNL